MSGMIVLFILAAACVVAVCVSRRRERWRLEMIDLLSEEAQETPEGLRGCPGSDEQDFCWACDPLSYDVLRTVHPERLSHGLCAHCRSAS